MSADTLNATFAALADPTRRAILARLARGETTVNELAAPLPISLPAVSKHLKVLERAGLISRSATAQWRPCKLEPAGLKVVADWVDAYRSEWEASLDRLDDYLRGLDPTGLHPAPPAKPSGSPPRSRAATVIKKPRSRH